MGADAIEGVDYLRALAPWIGEAAAGTMAAPHAVNRAMIAMWADALLDPNPVYVDDAAAKASGRAGIIAPPTMLQAWVMPKLSDMALGCRDVPSFEPWFRGRSESYPPANDPQGNVYRILADQGFANSAATNCRHVYHRELRPGDELTCVTTVEKVSDLKRTAMGEGHFITTRWEYFDQKGENVATQHWTVLRFRTPEGEGGGARPPAPVAAEPVAPGGPLVGAPKVGQRTEATVIPITETFVIATAFATHDFYSIHHATDWARSVGQPHIFSNILTTTGLVGGVVTRWAGPAVRLRSIDLRLFVPNYPGDALTLSGEVTAVESERVTMAVRGVNRLGAHVEAVVTADVPVSD